MDIVNNPWIIGIGGGILSGLVVTIISRSVLSKRENKEYIQKVFSANREIIYSIRPGISENIVPTPEIIESLRNSTARKYFVDKKDIYSIREIAQELIKEVMDSSFISAKTKEDYCNRLADLNEFENEKITKKEKLEQDIKTSSSILIESRERSVQLVSIMFGILSAMMTILIVLTTTYLKNTSTKLSIFQEKSFIILPTLFSITTVLASMLFLSEIQRRKKRRKKGEIEIMQIQSVEKQKKENIKNGSSDP
ncbi:hypothetical protein LLG96_19615 [bacterium]|nr:hypothetical protein [bacterium]